jgi:hypothetical protein
MLRVLILVGAFYLFLSVAPRKTRRSPTAVTPYSNGLDGLLSATQVSSELDESAPYGPWLASRRRETRDPQPAEDCSSNSRRAAS